MLEHTICPIQTKVNILKPQRFAHYRRFLGQMQTEILQSREPVCQKIPLLLSEQQAFKASVLK